jgi:phage terminase small subunit
MARPKGTAKATASETAGACPKSTLRPRPAAFVREYVGAGCKNAKQAAIRTGYAGGASAEVTASRLLDNPKVAAEIEKAQGRLFRRHEISADRVMRGIANIAFCNLLECLDDKGELLPLSRMPKRARQAIEIVFKDGKPSGLRVRDKLPALEMLAKLLGLLK